MNLAEYRRRSQTLADFLPWAALVEKGVILNKDGSFQRSARFRGPDLDSATSAELVAITGRLNNALRRLGSGWAIFVEAQRLPGNRYPESVFPDACFETRRRGAASPIRGGRRAFREQVFPDAGLAAAGRGRRTRRGLALREPRPWRRRLARCARRLHRPHRPRAGAHRGLHARGRLAR